MAVAGSVSGTLDGATTGPINSGTTGAFAGKTDSFVTVYDGEGDELWTQRRGARKADEASEIVFGADGTVYVSGRTASGLPGSTATGRLRQLHRGLQGRRHGQGRPADDLFTQSFGTTGADKPAGLVVDGTSVVTASVENGRAVLRRFDIFQPRAQC